MRSTNGSHSLARSLIPRNSRAIPPRAETARSSMPPSPFRWTTGMHSDENAAAVREVIIGQVIRQVIREVIRDVIRKVNITSSVRLGHVKLEDGLVIHWVCAAKVIDKEETDLMREVIRGRSSEISHR